MNHCGECIHFNWAIAGISNGTDPDWETRCRALAVWDEPRQAHYDACIMFKRAERCIF
jgi:hypothetical protein